MVHENISPKLPEGLRKNMEKFQAKNGVPIFLKGGPIDKVLFGATLALIAVGTVQLGHFLYLKSYKK